MTISRIKKVSEMLHTSFHKLYEWGNICLFQKMYSCLGNKWLFEMFNFGSAKILYQKLLNSTDSLNQNFAAWFLILLIVGPRIFCMIIFVCLVWGLTSQSTAVVILYFWASFTKRLTHTVTCNWQQPFFNQLMTRNYFMISLHESMGLD